jgi:hypothetical protein
VLHRLKRLALLPLVLVVSAPKPVSSFIHGIRFAFQPTHGRVRGERYYVFSLLLRRGRTLEQRFSFVIRAARPVCASNLEAPARPYNVQASDSGAK